MSKTLSILSLILILIMVPFAIAQEEAPGQVGFALQDLSVRLGTEVTLDDLNNWTWAENVFADASLGCPQPGEAYAQVTTRGYQFIIEYQNVLYDYRVSEDGGTVILCSQTDSSLATPTTAPQQPVNTPLPEQPANPDDLANCAEALPIRLMVGETARTTPGLNSNLRAEPDIDAEDIGDIPPGGLFTVVGGPQCSNDGIAWWQVQIEDGLTGWIAQGQSGLYYVEPIPQRLPVNLLPLTPENLDNLTAVSRIDSNFGADAAFSPDGNTLAVVSNNVVNTGIWLYDLTALESLSPTLIETENFITAMAFSLDGRMLVTGDELGNVEFWDTSDASLLLSSHVYDTPVRDIDFSADGNLLTTLSDDNALLFWGVPAQPSSGG